MYLFPFLQFIKLIKQNFFSFRTMQFKTENKVAQHNQVGLLFSCREDCCFAAAVAALYYCFIEIDDFIR